MVGDKKLISPEASQPAKIILFSLSVNNLTIIMSLDGKRKVFPR